MRVVFMFHTRRLLFAEITPIDVSYDVRPDQCWV